MAIYGINGSELASAYDYQGNDLPQAYDINGDMVFSVSGVQNALLTSALLTDTSWRTVAGTMPNASDSQNIPINTVITGMPYSSASKEDGYIQLAISLYTFMTAITNPNSVLYTQKSKGYTGYAYYGTVCTSLICSCWGLPCLITTVAFPKCDFVTQLDSFNDIQLGDMLLSATHAVLITGITYEQDGTTIATVETSESKYNDCIRNPYVSFSTFCTKYSAFNAWRYNYIDDVRSYSDSPFVPWDGVIPDLMTNFGDKVTRKYGTDIEINIIDGSKYASIEVYKDGTLIDTKSTLEDFTITSPSVGSYEVRMVNGNRHASTFFEIIDCSVSINGNTLTAVPNDGELVAVGGYPSYTTDANGKATSWNNPKRVHLLTSTEKSTGVIDISEMTSDSDCNGGILTYVKGLYGTVSFETAY